MKILKFGGSSVGSAERIDRVVKIVMDKAAGESPVFAVFSAFGGVTDQLIDMGKRASNGDQEYRKTLEQIEARHIKIIQDLLTLQNRTDTLTRIKISLNELEEILHGVFLVKELTPKTLDYIMSFGERLSAFIIHQIIRDRGGRSVYVDTRQTIKSDNNFGNARVRQDETEKNIRELAASGEDIFVVTGFIASTAEGETTTLGRGGSDYTASVLGAALNAGEIEIWTDVNGVMTADPGKVSNAFSLKNLTYEEAMELSHFGARVIYPPTMQPALDKKIPIRVLNSLSPGFEGTLISEARDDNGHLIKGISSIDHVCLLLIEGSGMIGVAGIAQRIFNALAREEINIIMISQASSEHSICIAVMPENARRARQAIEKELKYELRDKQVNEVSIEDQKTILAVVGENMRHTRGIAGRVFESLGRNGINISAIAQGSSELNISMVIARQDEAKALNVLHDTFFQSKTKSIHLYLTGTGLIGGTFLDLMHRQAERLAEEYHVSLKLVGISNSRKMVFDSRGIAPDQWQQSLENSKIPADMNEMINKIREFNLPNSIFLDCTASEKIPAYYPGIFEANVSIVTPNKKANADSYQFYRQLRDLARKNNVRFHYETNVGAALPVINTIYDLVSSGDRVVKLEGILSGTLSYIFNTFKPGMRFSDVIREAQKIGYTEPDPREDLNGMDVARKLLILMREAGIQAEPSDIKVEKLITEKIENAASVDQAMKLMAENDDVFEQRLQKAESAGKVLRYLARYEDGKANVGISELDRDHPFATLDGTENIIAIYSEHYGKNPLIIRGPGAGKEVTAAGVFADVMRIANFLMHNTLN